MKKQLFAGYSLALLFFFVATIGVIRARQQPAAPAAALTISPAACPQGTVGQPYLCTLTASGGVPPYDWSFISGSLPAGLSYRTSKDTTQFIIFGTPSVSIPETPVNFQVTSEGAL